MSFLSKIFSKPSQQPSIDTHASGTANRRNVLVVDDDHHLCELVQFSLEQEGHAVRVGANGADAVSLATEYMPDLIILDGEMPVMDGLEALKKLRMNKKTEQIPVIMLTARSHQVDMISGYRFGAQDYLTKPIAIEQLMASVKKLLTIR